ncbi:MAG: hypothetical protein K2K97_09270, partial [Muribaculaceae bacterium]|nr:hypothetical protein [Muribaculaceae bacterium]
GTRGSADNGTPEADDTDFANGNENAVNNAYFVFYDKDGNVVGDIVPIELGTLTPDEVVDGYTVEKSYKSVVAVSVRKGENKPSQVICYINPISPSTLNQPLDRIQTVSREDVMTNVGTTTYFAMSNSVFYPKENANSEPQVAVNIPEDCLYTSEAAAEAALGTPNTVNIYVERYASKLSFKAVDPTDYDTATRVYAADGTSVTKAITLKFTPQYWAINAEANRGYVIKSFRQESEDGVLLANNYTYTGLNARINPKTWGNNQWSINEDAVLDEDDAWDWNNPIFNRSYWGMSPAYFQSEYPEVSSDLREIEVNQKYISYKELQENKYGFPASNENPQYFKETTVGSKALHSANPNAAVASVIYVGQYSLMLDGSPISGNPGFYTYLAGPVKVNDEEVDRPYVYFENVDNSLASKVAGGESMLKRFFAQQTILYKKSTVDGKDQYTRYTINNTADLEALQAALVVDTISDKVKIAYDGDTKTKLKLQNNARTLQFKDAQAAAGIYILTDNGYKEIVSDEVAPVY